MRLHRLLPFSLLALMPALLDAAPAAPAPTETAPATLAIAGAWRVRLDRENAGERQRWFAAPLAEATPISLPGAIQDIRLGDPVGLDTPWTCSINDRSFFTSPEYAAYRVPENFKIPFWLQPDTYYAGRAWYQREIEIPATWGKRRVELELERAHWFTRVWIGDQDLGGSDSLSIPHRYELSGVKPGRHLLTILVDNDTRRIDLGENSHSVSDHTQGNWNGIVGRLALHATPRSWIDRVDVHPDLATRSVRVSGYLAGSDPGPAKPKTAPRVTLQATLHPADGSAPVALPPIETTVKDNTFNASYPLGDYARTWDEFSPSRYTLVATLPDGSSFQTPFGLREVRAEGRRILLNGRPIFIRGTLECAIFPRTGHPPTDIAEWLRLMTIARAHGLNMLRFHSWCPPRAAFEAADQLGVYLHVEVASWPNQSVTLGDDRPVDAWVEAETTRIVREYGNHPSFVFLVLGNEPAGPRHVRWLTDWATRRRALDSRHLVSVGSGWPNLPESQFLIDWKPRVQHWGAGLTSRINSKPPETTTDYRGYIAKFNQPLISHEIGQWCVYPNLAETSKYTGYLKAKNFEIFRDRLVASGLLDLAPAFLHSSGKLQALCYKEDIESALRTPGMAGFHLLDLHDFPGQGTALVGVLDPFWDEKGYITPAEYRRFCAETVPLARLPKRVFTPSDTLAADLEVAHWGAADLPAATAAWRLLGPDDRVLASGQLPPVAVPVGGPAPLGKLALPLASHASLAPARLRLEVTLVGTPYANDWDLWLYPQAVATAAPATPPGLTVTRTLDAATLDALEAGATVLAAVPAASVRGGVKMGFSPVFWNTLWTNGQPPHTLGLLPDPAHPALAQFPTEAWSNWQWAYPVQRGGALVLTGLPGELKPIVRVIDDWFTGRSLALAIECRVGQGRLLLIASDLTTAEDPVNRQLLTSLQTYAASPAFTPPVVLTRVQLTGLLVP